MVNLIAYLSQDNEGVKFEARFVLPFDRTLRTSMFGSYPWRENIVGVFEGSNVRWCGGKPLTISSDKLVAPPRPPCISFLVIGTILVSPTEKLNEWLECFFIWKFDIFFDALQDRSKKVRLIQVRASKSNDQAHTCFGFRPESSVYSTKPSQWHKTRRGGLCFWREEI